MVAYEKFYFQSLINNLYTYLDLNKWCTVIGDLLEKFELYALSSSGSAKICNFPCSKAGQILFLHDIITGSGDIQTQTCMA